jgi:hypothetical protein
LNLLRVPLDVLPISENSPADPFASRQPTKNFVRLSGKSSKKIYRVVTDSIEFWGIWELDSSHGGRLIYGYFCRYYFYGC